MKRLKGSIPRGPRDHRSVDGRFYTSYLRDVVARLGSLPPSARPVLRELGLVAVDLHRLNRDLDVAVSRRRLRAARSLRRQQTSQRNMLLRLELRLEEIAKGQPSPLAALLPGFPSGGLR